jgi:hypothetical protein
LDAQQAGEGCPALQQILEVNLGRAQLIIFRERIAWTLKEYFEKGKGKTEVCHEIRRIIPEILPGLQHLHKQGLSHGRISSSSIVFVPNAGWKLRDYALVKSSQQNDIRDLAKTIYQIIGHINELPTASGDDRKISPGFSSFLTKATDAQPPTLEEVASYPWTINQVREGYLKIISSTYKVLQQLHDLYKEINPGHEKEEEVKAEFDAFFLVSLQKMVCYVYEDCEEPLALHDYREAMMTSAAELQISRLNLEIEMRLRALPQESPLKKAVEERCFIYAGAGMGMNDRFRAFLRQYFKPLPAEHKELLDFLKCDSVIQHLKIEFEKHADNS